jgi:lambda family phage tail tape measure protein
LFSKAGRNIPWKTFKEELDAGIERYKDSEEGIKAMSDAANNLQVIWTTLMSEIAKGVGTDLKAVVEYLDKMKGSLSIVGTVFSTVFETIVVLGANVFFVIEQIAKSMDRLSLGFFASDKEVKAFWENYNKEAEIARKNLDDFTAKILEPKKVEATKNNNSDAPIKRQIELNSKQERMLAMAKLLSVEYERQQSFSLAQLAIRNAMVGMTKDEARVQEAINQVLQSTSQKIDDITKRREEAVGRKAGDAVIAEYDAQIAKITELSNTYVRDAAIIEQSSIQTQRTFEFGWNKAFNQFAEDAYNYGKLAEEMFSSFTGNMNSAIDEFVDKGTFSFSKFTESVIKDLLKIQLRMQASQLLSMGIKFGISAFTGSPQYADPAYAYAGYADGGNPTVGVPSIVGENGPELFIPHRSGTIIPNQQLSSFGNEQPQQVFNGPYIANMSAIDTQSGVQFLAKNKMTIWSMNQSANRSVPAGR